MAFERSAYVCVQCFGREELIQWSAAYELQAVLGRLFHDVCDDTRGTRRRDGDKDTSAVDDGTSWGAAAGVYVSAGYTTTVDENLVRSLTSSLKTRCRCS